MDELEPEGKHYRDPHNDGIYNTDYGFEPNPDMIYDRNNDHDGRDQPDPSARSDISADSIEKGDEFGYKRSQDRWLDSLYKKNALIVQVTYPRTANNEKELTVVRGEFLEVSYEGN